MGILTYVCNTFDMLDWAVIACMRGLVHHTVLWGAEKPIGHLMMFILIKETDVPNAYIIHRKL